MAPCVEGVVVNAKTRSAIGYVSDDMNLFDSRALPPLLITQPTFSAPLPFCSHFGAGSSSFATAARVAPGAR